MNATVKLFAAIHGLPESALAEVAAFAEFLRAKHIAASPVQNAQPLAQLAGGLENSPRFAGDALALQNQLRSAWH
jgi:hypothetical protein